MKNIVATGSLLLALTLTAAAEAMHFTPGRLAVLRAGDGIFDLNLRQSPVFVDELNPGTPGGVPTLTVAIPTNGPDSFFFNGHAATEGLLSRSADKHQLVFAGYGGVDLLAQSGTAARLDIRHGLATVDLTGQVHSYLYKSPAPNFKVNARGAATDGTNHFWGCGNTYGTFFYSTNLPEPACFDNLPNSRAMKIIGGTLYASINTADGFSNDQSPGIYDFLPDALPRNTNANPVLVVAAAAEYKKVAGFDLSPDGNTAYMADIKAGVQKYVKAAGAWKFAYNLAIPQNIPAAQNTATGCFGLTVDFAQTPAVIYATTTEGYGGSVNSNRVVRISDTGANATVVTLIQATSTNIAYRGVDLSPE